MLEAVLRRKRRQLSRVISLTGGEAKPVGSAGGRRRERVYELTRAMDYAYRWA
jgi:hypothetical protein